jgi:hypothetical protein
MNWMQSTIPTAAQRTARERRRAAHAWRRINDKWTVVTSVAFRTSAGVTLAAQSVRIESDNTATPAESAAGAAPKRKVIVYGVRNHATLTDTDIKEGYTFVYLNDLYRCTDIIVTLGEVQGIFEATG